MTKKLLLSALLISALLAGVALSQLSSGIGKGEPEFIALYPQPREIASMQLVDNQGEAFTQEDLQGKWTLAFLGYTYCPDICPTTLAELKRIYPDLKALSEDEPVQVLFVSVDPGRDTSERLNEYVNFFEPEFIGASAEHEVLFPMVRSLGLVYAITDPTDDPNYLVNHSASVVLINPQGLAIGRFKPTLNPGQLAVADGEQILADLPALING